MKVIIAEDDYDTIRLYEIIFAEDEVKILTDGDSFIMNYSEKYDVIILNLNMPKKSGLEVLEFLKKIGNKIPIFVITASTFVEHLINETVYVIYKPIKANELRKKIVKCVS
jgi:two-component system response regulator QseB